MISVIWAMVAPGALALTWGTLTRRMGVAYQHPYLAAWGTGAAGVLLANLAAPQWASALIAGAQVCAAIAIWWRRRRKRRRTLAALGAKTRALRDSLVRRMREVTKPRPVLKPQRMPV